FVSSETMASAPELERHRQKIEVLPYGVSPRLGGPGKRLDGGAVRRHDGPLRLLFVGRLVYYKGIDVLLKALALAPEADLRIVGDGADRNRLEALSAQLSVASRVQFVGSITDEELVKA